MSAPAEVVRERRIRTCDACRRPIHAGSPQVLTVRLIGTEPNGVLLVSVRLHPDCEVPA